MDALYFVISFFSSVIGAVCGLGGGVIIKPVLDISGLVDVRTATFFSGVAVLCMALFMAAASIIKKENHIKFPIMIPLGIGAAAGGALGRALFDWVLTLTHSADAVKQIQSIVFAVLMTGALIYILLMHKITPLSVTGRVVCVLLGLVMGISASFLGIGGGPIILVALFYFFGMDKKTAGMNSLFIIVFSQTAALIYWLITGHIPPFEVVPLILMIVGAVCGGIVGRLIYRRSSEKFVGILLIVVFIGIIGISIFNAIVV